MKHYIIRLKQNKFSCEIADACVDRAKQFGIDLEYFDGVYGIEGNDVFTKHGVKKFPKFIKKELPGRIGCAASHYLLWKRCLELNEPLLILEQDGYQIRPLPLDIEDNFTEVIKLDRCFPRGANMKYDDCCRECHDEKYNDYAWPPEALEKALPKSHKAPFGMPYFRGAWSYIIKPAGAKKVTDMFEQEGWVPADKVFSIHKMDIKTTTETIFRLHPFYNEDTLQPHSLTRNLPGV